MKFLRPNKTSLFDIYDHLDPVLHFCVNTDVIEKAERGITSPGGRLAKMAINCSLSTSRQAVRHYAGQFIDLPPLPSFITKNGPYVENGVGGRKKIIICYEFDKSKFVEAMENICKQLSSFHDVPEFTLFADSYNLHTSYYLVVEKGGEA